MASFGPEDAFPWVCDSQRGRHPLQEGFWSLPSLRPSGGLEPADVRVTCVESRLGTVTLASGQALTMPMGAMLLGSEGPVRVGEVELGSLVATARTLPFPVSQTPVHDAVPRLAGERVLHAHLRQQNPKIPHDVFSWGPRNLAPFLSVLLQGAGVETSPPSLAWATCFRQFALDLQVLLRRYSVRSVVAPWGGVYLVHVTAGDLQKLLAYVGLPPHMQAHAEGLRGDSRAPAADYDVVPVDVHALEVIREELKESPYSPTWAQLARLTADGWMLRSVFVELIAKYGYEGPLARWAWADVVWERVTDLSDEGSGFGVAVQSRADPVLNGIIVVAEREPTEPPKTMPMPADDILDETVLRAI